MAAASLIPCIAISVDLEPTSSEPHVAMRDRREMAERLLSLFQKHQLVATWAFANPADSPLLQPLQAELGAGHQVALSGDSRWLGTAEGRTRFAHDLVEQVGAARQAGLPLTTLAFREGQLTEHWDLLVKHKLSIVSGGSGSPRVHPQPTVAARYGIWCAPAPIRLPQGLPTRIHERLLESWRARRALQASAVSHLLIDGAALAGWERRGLRRVARLLAHLERQVLAGSMIVDSLEGVARRAMRHRTSQVARSVLRAA